jgi:hypothetical protein
MSDFRTQLKRGLYTGIKKGWGSFVWICKIVVPVSFLVALIQWTGWLNQLDFLLHPLMSLINLPAAAALPIVTATVVNFYAAIAIMAVLPFSIEQMTLIALFILIAHMLIMEGMIQHKSGFNFVKATLVRIMAAVSTVLVVSQFLGDTGQGVVLPADLTLQTPFIEILKGWAIDTLGLCGRIFVIIMLVMTLLVSLQTLGWIQYLLKFFRPFMRILGLSNQAVTMWVPAAGFGLLYGGAVIIEEAKKGALTKEELEYLHISIGINHAIVQEIALFLALGLNVFWLLIPRFVTAAIAVHTCRAIQYLKSKVLHK